MRGKPGKHQQVSIFSAPMPLRPGYERRLLKVLNAEDRWSAVRRATKRSWWTAVVNRFPVNGGRYWVWTIKVDKLPLDDGGER